MLPRMAARMAAHNWHIQFQMDGRELHTRESLLGALPCALVVEHIGKFFEPSAWIILVFRRCCGLSMAAAAG
jgi:D-galactarolactone isomerase